jgi:predicted negative regulator of RcsB-dependent stress response
MNETPLSLENLHDIIVPAPPSFWPLAPGLWLVLALIASFLILFGWHRYSNWKFNAYRRAGIALLDDAATTRDVSVILKRVALAAFPREEVASLYGNEWIEFLNDACSQNDISEIMLADSRAAASQELRNQARVWIQKHRIPQPRTAH